MWSPALQAQMEAPGPGGAPLAPLAWSDPAQGAGWAPSAADLLGGPTPGLQGNSPVHGGQHAGTWASGTPLGPEGGPPGHTAAAKIYVQGLPQSLQHPVAVAGLFAPFGDVLDVKLYAAEVRLSGGSAVVRMRNTTQAAAAIAALNGIVPDGGWQQLTVRAAETAEQRSSRITAINGRQGGPLGSPMAGSGPTLPPAGTGTAAGVALRRVHSSRGGSSQGSLQCYTGALLGGPGADQAQRRSVDWANNNNNSGCSMDSRRSSMDVARCGGRSSSDSGSEELPGLAAEAAALPTGALQRMLLEAVLALVGQVETGQLSLPSMRAALETALSAAKLSTGVDEQQRSPPATGYTA